MQRLKSTLNRIDRKGYGAYKDLQGDPSSSTNSPYTWTRYSATRSRRPLSSASGPTKTASFRTLFENPVRRTAFEDFLTRRVDEAVRRTVRGNRGSGGSGRVEIQRPSQVVLPRTSIAVSEGYVEARMAVGLPAQGRSVDARAARTVLVEELPEVARQALVPGGVDKEMARAHVESVEDAAHLRGLLPGLGLGRVRGRRFHPAPGERGERPAVARGRRTVREPGGVPGQRWSCRIGARSPGWGYRRVLRSWRAAGSTGRAPCSRRSRGVSTTTYRATVGSWS